MRGGGGAHSESQSYFGLSFNQISKDFSSFFKETKEYNFIVD